MLFSVFKKSFSIPPGCSIFLPNGFHPPSSAPSIVRFFQRTIKLGVNSVKAGNIIQYQGKPWLVTKTTHIVSGRGSANVKIDLKNILDGNKITERYSSSDTVEELDVHKVKLKYLYHTEDSIVLVNKDDDEFILPSENLQGWPEVESLLSEDTPILVSVLNDQPVSARIDARTLTLRIEETETNPSVTVNASMKGGSYKPAILQGGLKVEVPDFCQQGDWIDFAVDDEFKLKYVKRAVKG